MQRTDGFGCLGVSEDSGTLGEASSLVIRQGVCVDGDFLNEDLLFRPVLPIDLHGFDLVQGGPALDDPPEDRVLPVQMVGFSKGEEELAAVGVGPLVRHGQDAAGVVSQSGLDLVFEGLAVDAGRVFGCAGGGRAGLGHEGGYEAVEGRGIVGTGGAQGEEVVGGLRAGGAEELDLDGAQRGVQRDRHGDDTASMGGRGESGERRAESRVVDRW